MIDADLFLHYDLIHALNGIRPLIERDDVDDQEWIDAFGKEVPWLAMAAQKARERLDELRSKLRDVRADRDELREDLENCRSRLGPTECQRDEYRAASISAGHERDREMEKLRRVRTVIDAWRDAHADEYPLDGGTVALLNGIEDVIE